MMKKAKFDIQGMTCSSCQAHVEKAVSKLNGIERVNVNLLSNNMIVEYEENKLNDEVVINAVNEAGYKANLSDVETKNLPKQAKKLNNKEMIQSMKKRLIISVVFWLPLMYVAMHHMLYNIFGVPVPQFIEELLDGTKNAVAFGFTQFLLLLPIVYCNRNYFIIGFKRLAKRTPNMDSLIAIGSSAAILYGIYAIYMIGYGLGRNQIEFVQRFSMDLYFESAGTILTLITVRQIFGN